MISVEAARATSTTSATSATSATSRTGNDKGAGRESASLVEVFASAQGEGPEVGRTTVFVRFGGCDLRCRWCDSPGTWRPTPGYRIETSAGSESFEEFENPVDLSWLIDRIDTLAPTPSTWISLTGGEPLLQPEAISFVAKGLSALRRRSYLETHGLHADALASCVEDIDLISMDWKFASDVQMGPSVVAPPGEDFHDAHERFLRVAQRAGSVYVKAVLTPSTTADEIDAMIDRIERVSRDIPVVLQPVTPNAGVKEMPGSQRLLALLARVETRLTDVRLIPQTHPIYGVL